jgi:hypothetical protein
MTVIFVKVLKQFQYIHQVGGAHKKFHCTALHYYSVHSKLDFTVHENETMHFFLETCTQSILGNTAL